MNAVITWFQSWLNKLYDTFVADKYYELLLEGFGNTILITLGALVIGVAIGLVIAVIKYLGEDTPALRPLVWLCDLYVTVIRGIPIVVLLLLFFFVIMVAADGMLVAVLTFGINSGAYMAELIRSGIGAVDGGQMEAGRSLGMSRLESMRYIIFPQAVKYILPAVGNEFIALLKETSVAGYVTVVDVTRAANLIRNNTHDALNPLLVVALTYLFLVIVLSSLLKKLEKKLPGGSKKEISV